MGPIRQPKAAGAVTAHAGGGGQQRPGRQLPAQREEQRRLAAAAYQGYQRPAPEPQSLSNTGQIGGAHGSAGGSDLPDLTGEHDDQSHHRAPEL